MTEIILTIIIFALLALSVFMYVRTSRILQNIDKMIESAIKGNFSEREFTESRLSRLEAKMHRYLSAGETARNKLLAEQNTVKRLVSDISHQTKTPIANILLYSQLLNEAEEPDRNLLLQIEHQTEKLNFLIQSLIKTARLENGIVAVTPKKNSIRQLIEGIDYTAAAEQKGVMLRYENIPDLTADFDLKWTREAVSNIIDNAVKYTPQGGTVTVSASEYELFVKMDIADTGIGMTEEETAKIFTRFYRSSTVGDEKGVGIGLYLAREILSKEGGYIKVSSQPGKGSVFSVFLLKSANLSKL